MRQFKVLWGTLYRLGALILVLVKHNRVVNYLVNVSVKLSVFNLLSLSLLIFELCEPIDQNKVGSLQSGNSIS